jgi:hypothetical protein
MDTTYVMAIAALTGSTIGGLTSLTATWMTQHGQFRAQQLAHDITRREELYREFIDEASQCHADAWQHNEIDVARIVRLYALVSRMRILSSPALVEQADTVMRLIIATYVGPNTTIPDIVGRYQRGEVLDPLRQFSQACREELRTGVVIPTLSERRRRWNGRAGRFGTPRPAAAGAASAAK